MHIHVLEQDEEYKPRKWCWRDVKIMYRGSTTIMNKQSSELQITMDKADNGNYGSGDSRPK